ncbi:unnamed protein product [Tenebrio molitor]|nr:unnamed protein product [Tenebrio molitor]
MTDLIQRTWRLDTYKNGNRDRSYSGIRRSCEVEEKE